MGPRNDRELQTVTSAIDRLAKGQVGHAADLLAQRLKAVAHSSEKPGDWNQARFCELSPPTEPSVLALAEQHMLRKGFKLFADNDNRQNHYQHQQWKGDHGKGKDFKGQKPGLKGADKGWMKGKKGLEKKSGWKGEKDHTKAAAQVDG